MVFMFISRAILSTQFLNMLFHLQFSNGLGMFQRLGGRAVTSLKFVHPTKWGNTNTMNNNVTE